MSTIGRPSSYRPEYAKIAHNCCLLGAARTQRGEFFEAASRTGGRQKGQKGQKVEKLLKNGHRMQAMANEWQKRQKVPSMHANRLSEIAGFGFHYPRR